ncbi:MAG: helix-turn-helix domain-containing protein [Burkholderiales bacterium]|nr:helix-turn-helix domain-containing protein [Burkholderiales bacterium]
MSSSVTQELEREAPGDAAPGAVLREARESRNLTVADVARQLKLSVNQVEALEAGEFERLPGAVFVRGFVRNYARFLKLDAEPLLRAVVARLPHEEPRPAAPPSQDIPFPGPAPRRWRWVAAALALIVAAMAIYEFIAGSETAAPPASTGSAAPAPAPSAAAPVHAVPARPAAEAAGPVGPAAAGSREVKDAGPPAAAPGAGGAAAAEGEGAAPIDRGGARAEDAAPAAGEKVVHMIFSAESWVEIRDHSGRPIFSRLNRPGTEQRVSGRPPLALVVGNAHGVRLTYDERPVNLAAHTRVDVARLTLE